MYLHAKCKDIKTKKTVVIYLEETNIIRKLHAKKNAINPSIDLQNFLSKQFRKLKKRYQKQKQLLLKDNLQINYLKLSKKHCNIGTKQENHTKVHQF